MHFTRVDFPSPFRPHEGNLVAAFDGKIDTAENILAVERHCHIAHLHRVGTAARTRRKLQPESACVFLVHLYELEFLKHLYAALHLQSLGIRAFETLDEFLCVGNHLLLLLILFHLLFATLLAQLQILAVSCLVVVYPSHCHLDGASGYVVDKLAVVAYHHHGF